MRRVHIQVKGIVQGVGFRPFVFGLARRHALAGFVRNSSCGVDIEVEGAETGLGSFISDLRTSSPLGSRITGVCIEDTNPRAETQFRVISNAAAGVRSALVVPDRSPCEACLAEFRDRGNRRYGYPFINCVNCGPRYTLVTDLPYERSNTAMEPFAMCGACRAEYEDPSNRRFHAEATCCPDCGPRLALRRPDGTAAPVADPVAACLSHLEQGRIAAIKGVGGYHLACDARNPGAVALLRERKRRESKPFAIMLRDLASARAVAEISADEARLLLAPDHPIVLLRARRPSGLAEGVAPGHACYGVMLPYTPMHELLLSGTLDAIVLTSGNESDEPIAYRDSDAYRALGPLADVFLTHDRAIARYADDSIVRHAAGGVRTIRRSRGRVPAPIALPVDTGGAEVLAVGAELSNTVCLTRRGEACVSQHIGDLGSVAAYESLCQSVHALEELLDCGPAVVACDLHPAYGSTRYARSRGLPLVRVQHHHAHVASVLAEAHRTLPAIGVAFDGMGWGDDGTLWGGEFMICDLARYERVGYLAPLPLPGGDAAAKAPDRVAYAWLRAASPDTADGVAEARLPGLSCRDRAVIARMLEAGFNSPLTSSVGRLFDAASALLGVCHVNSHHARAAMEIEACATRWRDREPGTPALISADPRGRLLVHGGELLSDVIALREAGAAVEQCAARFHASLAATIVAVCRRIRDTRALATVALSGGVFCNALLLETAVALLEQDGFEVLLNSEVPANDGGISLGQAAVAAWRSQCA